MIQLFLRIVLLAVLITPIISSAQGSFTAVSKFQIDSYSLEYPTDWKYSTQSTPDGNTLHMFMGLEERNAMPYCHVTQQELPPNLAPRLNKLNEAERRDFLLYNNANNKDLLFLIYDNLATAQGFRLLHTNIVAIQKNTPAFLADFFFKVPQGFVYRVRSHYTFWPNAQLSIWCQAVAHSEIEADDAFQRNIANFQRFIASIRIKQ